MTVPPKHTWSARQAQKLGAKTLEEAAILTGLSEENLRPAWLWTGENP